MTKLFFQKLFTKKDSFEELLEQAELGLDFFSNRDTFFFETNFDPDPNGYLVNHKKKFVSAQINVEYEYGIYEGEERLCYYNGRNIIKSATLKYRYIIDKPKTLFTDRVQGTITEDFPCTIDFDEKKITLL
jgi:hypothetical protein